MNQKLEKISASDPTIVERRSWEDRRAVFSKGRFLQRRIMKKNFKERRSQAERRVGWVRVNKWSSVYLWNLKIAKFLR
jgi:hypothetical protein